MDCKIELYDIELYALKKIGIYCGENFFLLYYHRQVNILQYCLNFNNNHLGIIKLYNVMSKFAMYIAYHENLAQKLINILL